MKSFLYSFVKVKFDFILFIKFSIIAFILIICIGCNEEYSKSVDTTVEPTASQTKTSQLDIDKVIVGYTVEEY